MAMSSPQTERIVKNWDRIHKQTAKVMRAAPDEKLDWQPNEQLRTLRDLLNHFPQAELFIARTSLAGSTQKVKLDLSGHSVEEIASLFDSQLDQLNEEIEFYGRNMKRRALLWGMTEHEIHHRGQLFTYLRLAGVEPPNLYG